MKPNGLAITADGGLRVTRSSPVEDAVWDAVETAHGLMSVRDFIRVAHEAWVYFDAEQARENKRQFAVARGEE
jgi:citrate lyase beta subunit